jgi:hypothetical protein
VLVTDTHYTGGDRLLVEYKEGALQRSRRMAPDYELAVMSFSGLPYRTHTLRY